MTARPLVIAHRGASGYHPEHTRSAYLAAIAQGANAIEPDLVISKDGVLVIRHENEISGTTNVAELPQFADRMTTKVVDGEELTGWFTEDFTWAELSTLLCRERLPEIRPQNAAQNDTEGILRFIDLLEIADEAGNGFSLVVEIKHPTYFAGLGFSFEALITQDLFLAGWRTDDPRLIMESFEKSIIVRLKELQIGAQHFYIMEREHTAFDELVWALSEGVPPISNADELSGPGLEAFAGRLDGLALASSLLFDGSTLELSHGQAIVQQAHELGIKIFVWTLRPENEFLPATFRSSGNPHEHGNWQEYYSKLWELGIDGAFADHPDLAVRTRP
jgi:glycerophosphoryl diester phosphodiesterase